MSVRKKTVSFLVPSIADVLFAAVLLKVCLSAGKGLLADGDTGYHIVAGKYMLENLSIPRHDIFSFLSPPLPWTAHEWLSEVIMAVVHQVFGLTGVVMFFSFLIAYTCYLLFKTLRTAGGNILVAIITMLLVIAALKIHWLARPHIFSMLLLVIWYYMLDAYQYQNRQYLHFFPPLMLLWVNLHGGFVAGFILLGGYLMGNLLEAVATQPEMRQPLLKKAKHLSVVTMLCLLASMVNPFGYHILLFPFNLVSSRYIVDHVGEFMSPDFHVQQVFRYLLLLLLALLAASRKNLKIIEIGLILLFTNMALYSVRYIPLFAIIAAPILLRQAEFLLEGTEGRIARFFKNRAISIAAVDASAKGCWWLIAATVLVVVYAATGRTHYNFNPESKPVAAVEFLKKEHIKGNMFNNDEFGDYLIYSTYPQYKVFIDGRLDMYGVKGMKEYSTVINFEPGWEKVLDRYNIGWIFYMADSAFSRFLLENKNWHLVYADRVANIFVKNTAEFQYLINKYRGVKPVPPADKTDVHI